MLARWCPCLWSTAIGIAEEFWSSFAGSASMFQLRLCYYTLMECGIFLSILVKCLSHTRKTCLAIYTYISWCIFFQWFWYWQADFIFFKLSTFRLAVFFYLCVILVWFPVEFNYLVYITISGFDYNFGFCVFSILYFDSFLLFEFYSHQFRLVSALQILRFDSSTLYLFDSSAYYKQTSMLIWVCFMLVLAILRLSDVFSFVLGVVYRLGIK